MKWDARSESIHSLRGICRNHPNQIQVYKNQCKNLIEAYTDDKLKREKNLKTCKGLIDIYERQLILAKLELILRGQMKHLKLEPFS